VEADLFAAGIFAEDLKAALGPSGNLVLGLSVAERNNFVAAVAWEASGALVHVH